MVDEHDVVWRAEDGLLARVYRPTAPSPSDALADVTVLDVHGGAWASRDRRLGQAYNRVMAEAGAIVVAVDFRDGRQARHPAAVDDIAEAVAWVTDPSGFGRSTNHLVLTGSSSGGHLALHAALTAVEVEPALVAAFWPPVDPLGRYRYAKTMVGRPVPEGNRLDAAGLLASTEAYFGDEATMAQASIAELVRSGPSPSLPPVWLVEAGDDLNVPAELLDELETVYRAAGGVIERTRYPGEIHGFGHGDHPGGRRFRADLVERLARAVGPSDPTGDGGRSRARVVDRDRAGAVDRGGPGEGDRAHVTGPETDE